MNKNYLFALALSLFLSSCGSKDIQIADNTFLHGSKIYKVIDNEVREIADISDDVKKFEALKPKRRDFGKNDLSWVRQGAYANLKALYRGNLLYYNISIHGLNDVRESSRSGQFSILFYDEFNFILHQVDIPVSELIGELGSSGEIDHYTYSGKTEMSTEINSAIKTYGILSSVNRK